MNPSRQVKRADLRRESFEGVTQRYLSVGFHKNTQGVKYYGMPRKIRRAIAFTLAKKAWRRLRGSE